MAKGAKRFGKKRQLFELNKGKPLKPLNQIQKKQVKKLIKGVGETKRASWYNTINDGTNPARSVGLYSFAGWARQNNYISTNNTDILRLIPSVLEGTDDFSRIGNRITVNSLVVKGAVRVALPVMSAGTQSDVRVCLFILQHKLYKDYQTLYNNNDFNQLLDNQEGGTAPFHGQPINETMRVADQYYTVCHKKIITLRYAGVQLGPNTSEIPFTTPNCHNYYGTFSINLTKNIPKILKFPETQNPLTPEFANSPTNSSLFMSMGFVDQQSIAYFNGTAQSTPPGPEPVKGRIEQCYVSYLTYKDM